MGLVRVSLLAITVGTLGLACGGADEPEDTTPARHQQSGGASQADVGSEVRVSGDGAKTEATGEVKAGDVGARGKAGAPVDADDDSVKARAGTAVDGTTGRDKDDNSKQQPLPQGDPNQPNPEKPEQPPQPEQPDDTGTTP